MTAQTDLRPDDQISRERGGARKRLDIVGPIVLLLAMAVAAVMGVAVVARVTNPSAPTPVVSQEPNPNERVGRVAATATQEILR
jgi:hypothetical protein